MGLLKIAQELYHLSEKNLDGVTLYPRVPKNTLTNLGYEDGLTPRVSLSDSIAGGLVGLSQNLDGKKLFVHNVKNRVATKKPTTQEVPDVMHTNEIWALEPVTLQKIKEIDVFDDNSSALKYKLGNKEVETYGWGYK